MSFAADHLKLDLAALPWRSDRLRAEFSLGTGNNARPLLLIGPVPGDPAEPGHLRYGADLTLTLADGTVVANLAQLVVTSRRLLGMVFGGRAGKSRLDAGSGEVFAFSIDLAGLPPAEGKTTWLGKLTRVTLRSASGPPPEFVLELNSVIGRLDDAGRLTFGASLGELLAVLSRDAASGTGQPGSR